MLKILVTGISGRMGCAVRQAVEANPDTELAATHDAGQDITAALEKADAAIDFSFHGFTPELLAAAVAQGKPLVIGTTGHTDDERAAIAEAAKRIPIVFASNFSVGVNTLFWLTKGHPHPQGLRYRDCGDAPPPQAGRPQRHRPHLAEVVCKETGLDYAADVAHGRQGLVGERPRCQIGMHSLRGGDVVGDHTVMYATDGERVELTHKASSRMTFASGPCVPPCGWQTSPPRSTPCRMCSGSPTNRFRYP